jgi:hypothetical protein
MKYIEEKSQLYLTIFESSFFNSHNFDRILFQYKVLGSRGFPKFYECRKWRHNVEKCTWRKIDEIRVVGHIPEEEKNYISVIDRI